MSTPLSSHIGPKAKQHALDARSYLVPDFVTQHQRSLPPLASALLFPHLLCVTFMLRRVGDKVLQQNSALCRLDPCWAWPRAQGQI